MKFLKPHQYIIFILSIIIIVQFVLTDTIISSRNEIGTYFGSLVTNITVIIIAITAYFTYLQIKQASKSRQGAILIEIYNILEDSKTIQSRRKIFELSDSNSEIDWVHDEKLRLSYQEYADEVCRTYNFVGILVDEELISKSAFIREWGYSIKKSWRLLRNYVYYHRGVDKNKKDYWLGFEKLNEICIKTK